MTEKVVVSQYVLFGLIETDFLAALAGYVFRVAFDWYYAQKKVRDAGAVFVHGIYFTENAPKIVVSLLASVALLFIVPALAVWGAQYFLGKDVVWNSGFSGLMGMMGFDIARAIIYRGRREIKRFKTAAPDEE